MSYAGMTDAKPSVSNRIVDLRSDTVTRPGEAMRRAMAEAKVGDDVYGEDETVNALEQRVAALLGKEAGLFVASGTQSNLTAILSHCQRGEEYIAGETYHVFAHEAGGASALGGVVAHPLPVDARGGIAAEQVEARIKPDDSHCPITRLVCLENTVSGHVQPLDQHRAIAEMARRRGLSVHLDGARLMNAAVALGQPPAACGLYALENNIDRLADDHANAKRLAEGLAELPGFEVEMPETNMLFIAPREDDLEPLRDHMATRGIVIAAQRPKTRLVLHLDVTAEDVERTIDAFGEFYKG